MGICYSQQQQWESIRQNRRGRHRRPKPSKTSVIYEQKSIYESSFASNIYSSFREDLHHTISSIAAEGGEMFMGSLTQMKEQQLQILYKSLHKINHDGTPHQVSDPIVLCNLKTKNYLHTHKIKHPDNKNYHEISCCPYTSNHIPQYDIWKLIPIETSKSERNSLEQQISIQNGDQIIQAYIYHPFTQKFMIHDKGILAGSEQKMIWKIHSFGPRRNGGFVKISLADGQQLCMSQQKGLLDRHRKVQVCKQKHISHIWELSFADPQDF